MEMNFQCYACDNNVTARAMCSIARLLLLQRVCPSVTRRDCIETDKSIIKLFSWPCSPTTMVF